MQVAAYVNATTEIGLRFIRSSGLRLPVYTDADYMALSRYRKFMCCEAVTLGGTGKGYKSSTRKYVSTATCNVNNFACAMRLRRRFSLELFWYSLSKS